MLNIQNLLFILSFTIFFYIKCDIPVECPKNLIQGEWIFRINKETFQPGLTNPKTSCTHGFPDKIDQTIGDKDYSYDTYRDIVVTLNGDYKVYEENIEIGTWTPVYNEGFIANFKNAELFAFMKYFKNPNGTGFLSNCDKTMIGWYVSDVSNKMKNWSCFFGFKTKIKKSFSRALVQIKSFLKTQEVKRAEEIERRNIELFYRDDPIFLETKSKSKLSSMKYEDQIDYVNEINTSGLTWKADFNDNFKGFTLAQINEKIGSKMKFSSKKSQMYETDMLDDKSENFNTKSFKSNTLKKNKLIYNEKQNRNGDNNREQDSHLITNQHEINKYRDIPVENIDSKKLPLNWDWRNVGGVNYIPPPRKQEDCGSCYIFSSVSALESHLRIQTLNRDQTLFSKQYLVSCNPYTEGCEGGYPILVGKFLNEFNIIPETCFPYKAKNVDCNLRCSNPENRRKYKVSKYGYLGGFYGGTTEEMMMKEIRAHGPMPGNILVPWNFSYYKSGIYMFQHKVNKNNGKISKSSLIDRNLDWQKVEHSVLIVGWGEENGVKYWICLNTWGTNFGEGGFFRILRGENECNIESMGDFLRLKFEDL